MAQDSYGQTLERYGARARYRELTAELNELAKRYPDIPKMEALSGVTEQPKPKTNGKVDGRSLRGTPGTAKKRKSIAATSEKLRRLYEERAGGKPKKAKAKKKPSPPAPVEAPSTEGWTVDLRPDYRIGEAVLTVVSQKGEMTSREIAEVLVRSGFKNTNSTDIVRLVGVTLPRMAKEYKTVKGSDTERGRAWSATEKGMRERQAQLASENASATE